MMTKKNVKINKEAEQFLEELKRNINKTNRNESQEISQEIRSHIYESLHAGKSIDNILQQLGDPRKLAKTYTVDYELNHKKMSLSSVLSVLQLGILGLVGTVLTPASFFVSVLFIILAIFIIGIAVTNLLGFTQIPLMVMTSEYTLTGFPQFIAAFIISILMIVIGLGILKLIHKYCEFVINKYKMSVMQ